MGTIFLYGPPGSGKSTMGRLLADHLNLAFIDLDNEIEKTAGQTIPQIMNEKGEWTFREMESAALEKFAKSPACVIALGGGALLRDANRACAESAGEVVLLDVDLPTLLKRLKSESGQRPLLAGDVETKLKTLLENRKSHYESFLLRVTNMIRPPEEIAWEIQQRLGRFHVHGIGAGYDIIVQPGGLKRLGEIMAERNFGGWLAVVSDSNVSTIYSQLVLESLKIAGFKAHLLTIPAGEQTKTLDTISFIWHGLLEAGMDRKSTVIALGGGVTGDLAGFAASAYMRGVPWVGLPTSLLAMADSSLGGKTGCDLPEGKNLVGAFHSPRLVLSDPDCLSTLPDEELRSGLGEVVKHGVIADPVLFELCSKGYSTVKANLPEIVTRAMAVKIKIIEVDPFERGIRAALNFGHTFGHALETSSSYRLRHGEAVAIGMAAEAQLAERLGIADKGISEVIRTTLLGLGLPVRVPADLQPGEILKAMKFDKKKDSGVIRFALPVAIGEIRVDVEVGNLDLIFAEG